LRLILIDTPFGRFEAGMVMLGLSFPERLRFALSLADALAMK
jgi:hypothetical protein